MNLDRRKLLQLTAGGVLLSGFPNGVSALDYPTRPVRIVVGFPSGSAPDVVARLLAQSLSERLGQQFIVDDRPGAASNIGTEMVAKANPDGYALLMAVSGNAVNATLYTNLNFDFIRDLEPVAKVGGTPFVLTTTPAFPAKTVPEFIAHAKANPGIINVASAGVGTGPHMAAALFKSMTDLDLVIVPYRGNYMPDLLSGQVQVAFNPMALTVEYVKDGRLQALGVTSAHVSAALPGVPAIADFVPGYEASGWYSICAPKKTPTEIVTALHEAVNSVLSEPKLSGRLTELGIATTPMTRAEFRTFVADEVEKWGKLIRIAGIKPE
jgi:tripartite-type tricarboxylate transporter receptor subunit TctC